jgi:CDP-glycerol glycerophosphotransferase
VDHPVPVDGGVPLSDRLTEEEHKAPVVSVVIPCFDVEKYLDECLSSVVSQTHRALDIVLVDDGSSDATSTLVDEWAARDDRITAIHQSNRGLGAARNVGIAAATGDYIFLLDSDDLLPRDAVGRMVVSAVSTGSDIVSGVVWRFDSAGSWRADQYRAPFDSDVAATHLFREPLLVYDQMACAKLFRREFWDAQSLEFPEGTLYEDVELVMRAHCRAASVDLLSTPCYLWRRREGSDLSITQDRRRSGSTSARFAALARADALLRAEAPPMVWTAHGVKVLTVDIRLYSRLLEGAEPAFVEEFLSSAGPLASSISTTAVATLNPVMRQLHHYLVVGDAGGIVACTRLLSGSDGRSPKRVATGLAWLASRDPRALVQMAWASLRRMRRRTARRQAGG